MSSYFITIKASTDRKRAGSERHKQNNKFKLARIQTENTVSGWLSR